MTNKLEMEMGRTTGAGVSTPVEMLTAETAYNRQEPKAGSSLRQLSTGTRSPQDLPSSPGKVLLLTIKAPKQQGNVKN